MLTDSKIKKLQAGDKLYKVSDLNGLYIAVLPSGAKSFRFDYRFKGKRKTITFGKYGNDGISLAEAREMLVEARKQLAQGICPASYKNEQKLVKDLPTFEQVFLQRVKVNNLAHETVRGQKCVYYLHVHKVFKNKPIDTLTAFDVREVLNGLSSTLKSVYTRSYSLMNSTFNYAVSQGYISMSPMFGMKIPPSKVIKSRERYMTPHEISAHIGYINKPHARKSLGRLLLKILMYTLVRKMELAKAEWKDVDLENGIWFIPASNTKRRRDHTVYLSTQVIEMFRELKTYSTFGKYVAETSESINRHIAPSTINSAHWRVIRAVGITDSTVHDTRRTASTHLNELGYNADWIEKSLAHNKQNVRSVYNRAKYAKHRRRMLQEWADTIDRWVSGDFSDVEDLY
ncbi:TPA: tyrosine-type recombinase/integrase [Pasteurella multocida]